MMNPGNNYIMMRMRQTIAMLEKENKELKAEVAELKASGGKVKPKKAFADEPKKEKPVVKKVDFSDTETETKE